jgi:hypothetical protein
MNHLSAGSVGADLSHAVTRYDRAQEAKAAKNRRAYHNPNALAIYLGRVHEIAERVERGANLGAEINRELTDRLLDYVIKYMRGRGHAV